MQEMTNTLDNYNKYMITETNRLKMEIISVVQLNVDIYGVTEQRASPYIDTTEKFLTKTKYCQVSKHNTLNNDWVK